MSVPRAIIRGMDGWWEDQVAGATTARPVPAVYHPDVPGGVVEDPQRGAEHHRAPIAAVHDEWQRWWMYAQGAARRYARGISPPEINVYGPVLAAGEVGLLEAQLSYSRLYAAGDGRYHKNDMFVVGKPAVMVGALAVNAAINHRRKVAARRAAEQRWRDQQQIQVTVTNRRLLCNTLDQGFESYSYGAVTEFYPDLDGWQVTLGFKGKCAPLRLAGPAVPAVCLWVAAAVLGERWMTDPRLTRLFA